MTQSQNQSTLNTRSLNTRCCEGLMPWLVLLGLIVVGCGSRLLIDDIPNFKPIAAIALFSGFYFRRTSMAILATSLSLLISDWQIGSYAWPIALSVYGSLIVGCILGRYFIANGNRGNLSKAAAARTGFAALAMSILFFAVTNLAVWACGWYPPTGTGLVACYYNAIPFFKYTIAGDLLFTTAIFGSYAMATLAIQKRSLVTLQ